MKFFGMQLLITLGWLFTLGACAFVIQDQEGRMMCVLQGWAMDEPWFYAIEMDYPDGGPDDL